jgi:hypothetical protein
MSRPRVERSSTPAVVVMISSSLLLERRVNSHACPQHHGASHNPLAVISRVEANGWKRNHFGATGERPLVY